MHVILWGARDAGTTAGSKGRGSEAVGRVFAERFGRAAFGVENRVPPARHFGDEVTHGSGGFLRSGGSPTRIGRANSVVPINPGVAEALRGHAVWSGSPGGRPAMRLVRPRSVTK
jgi:hypothetical protein